MKIKAIANICNSNKTIQIYENEVCQWIGNGAVIYPLYNLPKLSEEHIFTMFDIPEDKKGKYIINVNENMPLSCCTDAFEGEQLLERSSLSIQFKGYMLEPIKTSQGMIFINEKYFTPFSDSESYELYERVTPGGQPYIAVKEGFLLLGCIMPIDIITDDFIEKLTDILNFSKVALMNKESKAE